MGGGIRPGDCTQELFVPGGREQPARSGAVAAGSWSIRIAGSWALQAGFGVGSRSWDAASAARGAVRDAARDAANAASMERSAAGDAEAASWLELTGELGIVASTGVGWSCRMASVSRLGFAVGASAAGSRCPLRSRVPSLPCLDDEAGLARGC